MLANERPTPATLRTASAAAAALDSARDGDAAHAVGVVDLLWADAAGKSLDKSISYLELAARLSGRPANALVDLSAAYLVRAERRKDARDLLVAVERAVMALEADSTNRAARFNLALALSRLRLHGEATAAWTRALSTQVPDEWHAEIRARRAADSAIACGLCGERGFAADTAFSWERARSDRQWGRAYGWEVLLPRWAEHRLRGDTSQSVRVLALADSLASDLLRTGGDATLEDAVHAIRDSSLPDDLARAHAAFGHGRRNHDRAAYPEALAAYNVAISRAATSPVLRAWARLEKGVTLSQSGALAAAMPFLQEALMFPDTVSALRARALRALGAAYSRTARTEEGITQLRAARAIYVSLGERENIGTTRQLEAVAQVTLGDRDRVVQLLHESLEQLRFSRASVNLHNALYLLAELAAYARLSRAALLIQREGVRVAEASGDPLNLSEALIAQARIERASGRTGGARATLDRARGVLASADEGLGKEWVGADLDLAQVDEGANGHSFERVDRSLRFFQSVAIPLRVGPALLVRAELGMRRGDTVAGRADLEELVRLSERELRGTHDAWRRASVARVAQTAIERLARIDLASGAERAALLTIERGRALLEWQFVRRDLQQTITSTTRVVVTYALLADTIHMWVIRPGVLAHARTAVSADSLRKTATTLRALMELGVSSAATSELLARVYDWLIRPIDRWLPDSGTIGVVADGEITTLPVAAALDTGTQRYAIERWAIEFSGTLGQALDPRGGEPSAGHTVVIVDPAFDATAGAGLSRLPAARVEGAEVAARYKRATLLVDTAATWGAVRRSLPGARVVHFAGHAVFAADDPARSALLMAAGEAGSVVPADSIARADMRAAALVVLSACDAARPYDGRLGGLLGLASMFHRAGARGVVGGLWRVDDASTRHFMTAFHESYARSSNAAGALRATALTFLRSGDARLRSPSRWAAFQHIHQ